MLLFDPYFLLLIPAFIFAVYAQFRVRKMYVKYSKISARNGYTGAQAARKILDSQGLRNVPIKEIKGTLTDHYNPLNKTLNLSSAVYRGNSLASVGIAAHESGHAVQHARLYLPLMLRSGVFPAVRFSSWAAFPLFFIGFLFHTPVLMDIGILIFIGVVIFQLITLPVEFNASHRAMKLLVMTGVINTNEAVGAQRILDAAALTYLAATAVAIINLLRLILLRQSSR